MAQQSKAQRLADEQGVRIYAHTSGGSGGFFSIQERQGGAWVTLRTARDLDVLYGHAEALVTAGHPRALEVSELLRASPVLVVYEQPSVDEFAAWCSARFTHQKRAAASLGMKPRALGYLIAGERDVTWPTRSAMALIDAGEAIDAALAQLNAVSAGDAPAEMMARVMAARALLNGGE